MRGLRAPLRAPLVLLTIAFAGGLAVLALLAVREPSAADAAGPNDAVQRLSTPWPRPEKAGPEDVADRLRVVDAADAPVPLDGEAGAGAADAPGPAGRAAQTEPLAGTAERTGGPAAGLRDMQ